MTERFNVFTDVVGDEYLTPLCAIRGHAVSKYRVLLSVLRLDAIKYAV